jgi:hypothetical protein
MLSFGHGNSEFVLFCLVEQLEQDKKLEIFVVLAGSKPDSYANGVSNVRHILKCLLFPNV